MIISNRGRNVGYIVHLAILSLAFGVVGTKFYDERLDTNLNVSEVINLISQGKHQEAIISYGSTLSHEQIHVLQRSHPEIFSNLYTQSFSHHLRYKNQAILVTYKTINEDNPLLDCRLSGLNEYSPIKVIICLLYTSPSPRD